MDKLALFGGEKAVKDIPEELFKWPIFTEEDEQAVLDVLRRGAMSDTDITIKFENEFGAWLGAKHTLAYCNGTMSLAAAMFAVGLGQGDELICPSKTYWASCLQAFSMGATVVFADIDEKTLCIDPKDVERCISPATKAIMVVHYLAHPADMDAIMEIANKHNIKVIEDVSHAQGGLYKGRKLGTIGHVGAMSLMSGKSFAIGEAGMLITDDRFIYERALAYAHYERNNDSNITDPELRKYSHMPLGGVKGRLNQTCSAAGRVQLKFYDERCEQIRSAMNYFWDGIEDLPGIRAHRVDEAEGSNMAGWYAAHGIYKKEELEGLPLWRFCEALRAEGAGINPYGNYPLHTHRFFHDVNLYHTEKPTRIAYTARDVRTLDSALPVSESIEIYSIPWFKKFYPEHIDKYINAFKKVTANYKSLLSGGEAPAAKGRWYFYTGAED